MIRKTRKILIFILIILFFSGNFSFLDWPIFEVQKVFAASSIATSTYNNGSAYSFQRKNWHDGTRFWSAVFSGTDIKFYYSTDGSSWTQNSSATIMLTTNDFSIEADSNNAFIVYKWNGDFGAEVSVQKASSYPGTSFSWGSFTTIATSTTGKLNNVGISKDSNNKIWARWALTAGTRPPLTYREHVRQSTNANDISAWGTDTELSTSDNSSNHHGVLVPLTSGQMYDIWTEYYSMPNEFRIIGKKYNGSSWDALETNISFSQASNITKNISAVSDSSDNIHLVYVNDITDARIKYQEYTGGVWQSAITLDGNSTNEYPTISISGTDLYAFWIRSNTIYYKKAVSPYGSSNWDTDATSFYSTGTNVYSSAPYNGYVSGVADAYLTWTNGTASPYNIYFDKFSSAPAGTLTIDIVDSGGNSVSSPSVNFSSATFSYSNQDTTGTFGSSSQKIRVDNGTSTPTWTANLAGSATTATWTSGSNHYDFNDASGSGYTDGADTDSYGGQLTVNPSTGTIAGVDGCSTSNVSLGTSESFEEGTNNSIDLFSAAAGATAPCKWDLTGVGLSQKIPASQPAGSYSINLVLTVS